MQAKPLEAARVVMLRPEMLGYDSRNTTCSAVGTECPSGLLGAATFTILRIVSHADHHAQPIYDLVAQRLMIRDAQQHRELNIPEWVLVTALGKEVDGIQGQLWAGNEGSAHDKKRSMVQHDFLDPRNRCYDVEVIIQHLCRHRS